MDRGICQVLFGGPKLYLKEADKPLNICVKTKRKLRCEIIHKYQPIFTGMIWVNNFIVRNGKKGLAPFFTGHKVLSRLDIFNFILKLLKPDQMFYTVIFIQHQHIVKLT